MVPVICLHPRPLPEPLSNSALRLWLGRAKELEVASLVSSKQDLSAGSWSHFTGFPVVSVVGVWGLTAPVTLQGEGEAVLQAGPVLFRWDSAIAQALFPIRLAGLLEMCDVVSVKWASQSWQS